MRGSREKEEEDMKVTERKKENEKGRRANPNTDHD